MTGTSTVISVAEAEAELSLSFPVTRRRFTCDQS
jgi:hypothetical protein